VFTLTLLAFAGLARPVRSFGQSFQLQSILNMSELFLSDGDPFVKGRQRFVAHFGRRAGQILHVANETDSFCDSLSNAINIGAAFIG
jgi:hypothetical protein